MIPQSKTCTKCGIAKPIGSFGLMDIPLVDICPKFEGTSIARFLQRKRRNAKERYSLARAA